MKETTKTTTTVTTTTKTVKSFSVKDFEFSLTTTATKIRGKTKTTLSLDVKGPAQNLQLVVINYDILQHWFEYGWYDTVCTQDSQNEFHAAYMKLDKLPDDKKYALLRLVLAEEVCGDGRLRGNPQNYYMAVAICHYDHSFFVFSDSKHQPKHYRHLCLNYMEGSMSNENYDLDKCLAHLKKREDPMLSVPEQPFFKIPYYNRTEHCTMSLQFSYCFLLPMTKQMNSFDTATAIKKKLGLEKFRIERKDE
jgi:hypothetical protein